MVRTVLGHKLTGVGIVPVPRLLASVERTCVGVALSSEVEDRINSRGAVSDSDHDCILIRTHNVCDAIQHDKLLVGKEVKEGRTLTAYPPLV